MKKRKINRSNNEININNTSILYSDNNIDKYLENNSLVNIMKKQIDGWKLSLKSAINEQTNKCIIIYQSFVVLELYTKASYCYFRKITNFYNDSTISDVKSLKNIKHSIDQFIEEILNSNYIPEVEKNNYRDIGKKIQSLRNFTNLESISMYPDLRYNLNKNGDIIDKDLTVPIELVEVVREVIDIANI